MRQKSACYSYSWMAGDHTLAKWKWTELYFYCKQVQLSQKHWNTLCSEKSLFSIITLAFLGQFYTFLYQWKQEWILYNQGCGKHGSGGSTDPLKFETGVKKWIPQLCRTGHFWPWPPCWKIFPARLSTRYSRQCQSMYLMLRSNSVKQTFVTCNVIIIIIIIISV